MKRQEGRGHRREISRKPHQSPAELSLVRGTNVRVKTKVTSQVLGDVWSQADNRTYRVLGTGRAEARRPGHLAALIRGRIRRRRICAIWAIRFQVLRA